MYLSEKYLFQILLQVQNSIFYISFEIILTCG